MALQLEGCLQKQASQMDWICLHPLDVIRCLLW